MPTLLSSRTITVAGPAILKLSSTGAHKPVESAAYQTLSYYPPGHKIDTEHIDRFDVTESLQSDRWSTGDFNFKTPGTNLDVTTNTLGRDAASTPLEIYEWPGNYNEVAAGEELAGIRAQELYAQNLRSQGSGNVRDIVCGTTFTLENFPQESANQEYLVLAASFTATEVGEATGTGEYSVSTSFTVQPATVAFRPPRTIARPHAGPQTAIVTGPENQQIWTDLYGRVKIKFHWDRSPVDNNNSSCWVRVSYPWAGSRFGGINVPRVGQEVIVDFENNDPNRPIITGRVYNAANMPPWQLPDNASQSGGLTRSTQVGGYENANALRFEDRTGREQVWLHAEKDMLTEVENDATKKIGNTSTITVGKNQVETVVISDIQNVGVLKMTNVGLINSENVGAVKNVLVGGESAEEVG